MAVTRIKNNQITDATIVASTKLQDYSISSAKLANNLSYGSNLTITGNLTVQGNTTAIDTNITTIEDPVILLASTQTGAPAVDIGFLGQRGTSTNIAFVWDESQGLFVTAFSSTAETATTISIDSYASIKVLDSNVTGNLIVSGYSNIANLTVAANSVVSFGNVVISNVGEPLANADAATKFYVDDKLSSSSFFITDGSVTESIIGGDTIDYQGTTDQIDVTVAAGNATTSNVTVALSTNVSVVGNVTVGNILTVIGTVNSNLVPSIDSTYDLGSETAAWRDLYISGNSIKIGVQRITSNAESITLSNTVTGGNIATTGTVSATGNITGGNILTGGVVSATGTATAGNLATGGTVSATGTGTFGNVATGGTVSATGNIDSGNVNTGGAVSATSTVTGGNLATGGTVSATGTGTFGNVATAGTVSATGAGTFGNIYTGGEVSATGNVTGGNLITLGTFQAASISATGNIDGGNLRTAGIISATGTATVGNLDTGGTVSATSTVTGGNLATGGTASATGTGTFGNVATGGTVSATGTATVGNLDTGGTVSATGTGTFGNVATAGIISATGTGTFGNVATAGTVSATGSGTFGNIFTAGTVSATGNIDGSYVNSNYLVGSGNLSLIGNSTITLAPVGNVYLSSRNINNLADPVQDYDAANKKYVDEVAQGLDPKASVIAASYAALPAYTYNNGASGVGATITASANGALTLDGVTPTAGARVLIKNETGANDPYNGIYVVTTAGNAGVPFVLTRATDFDNGSPSGEIPGAFTFVETGTVQADTGWVCTTNNPVTVGTTAITFTQFSGAGQYTANASAGLSLTGTVFSAKVDNLTTAFDGSGNISIPAGAVLTTPNIGAATGTSLSLTGTLTSASVAGNVISGASLSITGNVDAGNLQTSGAVSATGTATAGNLATGGTVSATGTGTFGNVLTGGNVSATGNVTGGNVLTGGNVSATGTIDSQGTGTFGNVATGGTVSATSTITGGNIATGGTVSATGTGTFGNVATGGTVSATGTGTFGNVATVGTISATGNIDSGNVNTGGAVNATGNITGGNLFTSGSGGAISGSGNIIGGNILTGGIVSATGAGTFGNVFTPGVVSAVGNITANVGSFFIGNGSQLTGVAASSANAETLTGSFLANNVTGSSLTAVGNIVELSVVGTTTTGNLATGGTVSATGNITAGNVLTGGAVSATGTGTFGNVNTAGNVSATGNINSGNVNTVNVSATGLVSAANVLADTGGIFSNGNIGTLANINAANGSIHGNAVYANVLYSGNIVISNDNITGTNGLVKINSALESVNFVVNGTKADVLVVNATTNTVSIGSSTQTTGATLAINATDSVLMPSGNTAARPVTGVTGMLRFNTQENQLEVYDNSAWAAISAPDFTVIVDDQFNGDGATVAFTLSQESTTAASIVSINGVQQIPTTAYSVTGTTLTFTEAPATGDVIDVRILTTTTSVTSISNASGNAVIAASATSSTINVTGDLSVNGSILGGNINSTAITFGTSNVAVIASGGNVVTTIAGNTIQTTHAGGLNVTGVIAPTANVTYDLGTTSNRWKDLYLSNSTIYMGNSTISANATSIVLTNPQGGQLVSAGAPGSTELTTATVSATGTVTGGNIATGGTVSATGNITGSYFQGNGSQLTGIDATSIQNGTSSVSVIASGGNVRANVAGATVTTTYASGVAVTGIVSASGTVTGGNLATGGTVSATGNVTGGNVNVGNITIATDLISSLGATLTIDPATIGNAGLVIINGNLQVNGTTTTINSNVVSTNDLTVNYANNAINSAAANGAGIEAGPIGSPFITWLYNNTANVWTSSGGISAVGNVTGSNLLTSGLLSATGNLTVGGDLNLVGNIVDTGPMTLVTSSNGNITLSPNGSGVIIASKDIINGQANGVGNIGSATTYFNTVFAKATSAQYADLAEKYTADAEYAPGTVLEFGGAAEVTLANQAGSTRVAGVVSTNPSYIMNAGLTGEHVAMVALQGRVPCRVIGPVAKGDMMVAAGNGAARVDNTARAGSIIGKALENFDGAEGTIEVVIGRN